MPQRGVNKRDQRFPVMIDAEVVQREIAVDFVVAVGFPRKVIGADRHAAAGETRTGGCIEQLAKYRLPILVAQRFESGPAEFIEAGTESLDRRAAPASRSGVRRIDIQVQRRPVERWFEYRAFTP